MQAANFYPDSRAHYSQNRIEEIVEEEEEAEYPINLNQVQ